MISRNTDLPLRVAPKLILDAKTFYEMSTVTREPYVPQWIQKVLDDLSMEYNFIALFPPEEQGGKIKEFLKKVISGQKENFPSLGRETIIPYEQWYTVIKEQGTPLLYVNEPSNPLVYSCVPARARISFMSDIKAMHYLIGQYQIRLTVPEDQKRVPPDIRKAYQAKKFATGIRDRFSRKFQ